MEHLIWYGVILSSLIAGYLIGFNRGQAAVSSQLERILKQTQEQAMNATAILRGTISELEAQLEVLRDVKDMKAQADEAVAMLEPHGISPKEPR